MRRGPQSPLPGTPAFQECAASVRPWCRATCAQTAGCRRWTAGRRYQGRRRFRSVPQASPVVVGRPAVANGPDADGGPQVTPTRDAGVSGSVRKHRRVWGSAVIAPRGFTSGLPLTLRVPLSVVQHSCRIPCRNTGKKPQQTRQGDRQCFPSRQTSQPERPNHSHHHQHQRSRWSACLRLPLNQRRRCGRRCAISERCRPKSAAQPAVRNANDGASLIQDG